MFKGKVRGVVFEFNSIAAYSEKFITIDNQRILTNGNLPSDSEDTNCINVNLDFGNRFQMGNLSKDTVHNILDSAFEKGILDIDKLGLKFVTSCEDKIDCYEKGIPFVFITPDIYKEVSGLNYIFSQDYKSLDFSCESFDNTDEEF